MQPALENSSAVRFKVAGKQVDNAVDFLKALPQIHVHNGHWFRWYKGEVEVL